MLDSFIRATKDRLLAPLATRIGQAVHPNTVTVVAWLAGMAAALAAALGAFPWALALWLVNRLLDGFDGTLARTAGTQSDTGGYLDILLDFSVYAMLPIALVLHARTWAVAVAGIVLLATFYVNAASWMYLAAILERRDLGIAATGERTTITMPAGLIEGTETFILYVLFLIFPAHLTLLFTLMSLGVIGTIAQRMFNAWPLLTNR